MKLICSIYKSPRKDGMYLYVEKRDALKRVPEGLIAAFGAPQLAFEMVLTPERQLAREDITKVLANIKELRSELLANTTSVHAGHECPRLVGRSIYTARLVRPRAGRQPKRRAVWPSKPNGFWMMNI